MNQELSDIFEAIKRKFLEKKYFSYYLLFMKRSYQQEDMRLLTYVRLQNMMALLMAVAFFTSMYLGPKIKLRVLARHVLRAARKVFGIPNFRLYALADGIKHLLFYREKVLKLSLPHLNPASFKDSSSTHKNSCANLLDFYIILIYFKILEG